MLNVRLAGDHVYGKLLFTWLSLVMSMMVSFCAVLFPTRCLGWDFKLNWLSFWGFPCLLLLNMSFVHVYQFIWVLVSHLALKVDGMWGSGSLPFFYFALTHLKNKASAWFLRYFLHKIDCWRSNQSHLQAMPFKSNDFIYWMGYGKFYMDETSGIRLVKPHHWSCTRNNWRQRPKVKPT